MRGPMGALKAMADRLVRERVRCGESKGGFEGGHPNVPLRRADTTRSTTLGRCKYDAYL